jgi:dienelactone hydrolase
MTTKDGYHVAAWYWPPSLKLAPGVLLLHQRGKDKSSWGRFPELLTKQGYAVLAIDLRGHGETTGPDGKRGSVNALTDADYMAMLNDVSAADDFLHKQKGVDADRIGIIGASIGANLAIMYLAGDRHVRTAVCLSPGLDFRGLKPMEYMKKVDKRPLYLIASKGDEYSAKTADELSRAGTPDGPKSLRLFQGNEHGTDLLRANEGLAQTIASGWLLNYLPPKR